MLPKSSRDEAAVLTFGNLLTVNQHHTHAAPCRRKVLPNYGYLHEIIKCTLNLTLPFSANPESDLAGNFSRDSAARLSKLLCKQMMTVRNLTNIRLDGGGGAHLY